jgi:hypothetical protein
MLTPEHREQAVDMIPLGAAHLHHRLRCLGHLSGLMAHTLEPYVRTVSSVAMAAALAGGASSSSSTVTW